MSFPRFPSVGRQWQISVGSPYQRILRLQTLVMSELKHMLLFQNIGLAHLQSGTGTLNHRLFFAYVSQRWKSEAPPAMEFGNARTKDEGR